MPDPIEEWRAADAAMDETRGSFPAPELSPAQRARMVQHFERVNEPPPALPGWGWGSIVLAFLAGAGGWVALTWVIL